MKAPRLSDLFEALARSSTLGDDAELAALLRGLRNLDGSWKTTRVDRHAEANAFLAEQLAHRGVEVGCLFDVGVSSGVTTSELIGDLRMRGLGPSEVVAVDRAFEAWLARLSPRFHVLLHENGHVLRLQRGALDITPWCSPRDWLTGAALVKKLLHRGALRRMQAIGPLPPPSRTGSFDRAQAPDSRLRRLDMVSPGLARTDGVTLLAHDLLESFDPRWHGRADVVRAANVLNTDRLAADGVRRMTRNLAALGRDGAFFFACRSTRRSVRASLFVVGEDRLELQANLGGGVDAEPLLHGLDLAPRRSDRRTSIGLA